MLDLMGAGQAPAKICSGSLRGKPLPHLVEETVTEVADKLAETWRTGIVKVDQAPPIVLEPVPVGG